MDWSKELSPAARERLARVGAPSEDEKAAAAEAAELDELLRLYYKNDLTDEELLERLKVYESQGRWDILRTARASLQASFKASELRIQFVERPGGSLSLESGEPAAAEPAPEITASVLELTDATFDAAVREHPLLVVDCWAVWCGPCRMVAPVIEELARDYAGRVAFAKLDVDHNRATAARFNIQSIPTLLFFKDGRLVDQKLGAMPKTMLEPIIAKHLGNASRPETQH